MAHRICLVTLWAVVSVLDLRGKWKKAERKPSPLHACVCSVVTNSLRSFGLQPVRLLYSWDFSGRDTGVGCHFPTPGDLPNPRSNLCLLGLLFPHNLAHLLLTDCAATLLPQRVRKCQSSKYSGAGTSSVFFFFFLIFWPHHSSCGILVSWPGIEPVAPVGEAWGLNHWTPREVFGTLFFNCWS